GITGFGLIMDSSNTFSTSSLVTGRVYAADYTPPSPSFMTTAIGDMEIAYTDAAGRTNPTATELGAGDISGMTIAPGLYKWGTGVAINTGVTLSGGPNDVWIFQIAQDLTVANGAIITLSGGAQAKNIFWQVAGQATLGTTSDFKGIILSQTLIEVNTGAVINGRALAQTAVTLDANAVTAPTESTPAPTNGGGSTPASGGGSGSSSGNNGGSTNPPAAPIAQPIANETAQTVPTNSTEPAAVANETTPAITLVEPATNQTTSGVLTVEPKANGNTIALIAGVIAILLALGGAYYYFKVMKK
ncbi:MAG: ice-binding family protein, partial [Candidatus Micrarchaeota archaeon]|nr:ice-binding family protein [Candidatus Micrarchaeota archaeon]